MIKLRFVLLGMVAGLMIGSPVRAVSPDEITFRSDVLHQGTPRQAGLRPGPIESIPDIAASYLAPTPDHPGHPSYAGAAVLAARHGVVVSRFAVGDAVRWATPALELPPEQRVPARVYTLWDLASITKLFTTIVVLQQVEAGRVDLDALVSAYLPEFRVPGATVRNLLTHTAGLPPFRPFHSTHPTPETRLAAALSTPATAGTTPGGQYAYSDIGLIDLGVLVERVAGKPLADLVRAGITGPLRMRDTGFRPTAVDRTAATEFQPYAGRGLVRGEVHDENAWSLGGVAGHAGIFSTVDDLAILCQTLLNGGIYRGERILPAARIRQALVNYNADLLDRYPDSSRGLGFELAKHVYMDGMTSPVTFGHTGFTGTSVVIDPLDQSFLVLLSNRVHPDRAWGPNTAARAALARAFADARPIAAPSGGGPVWRTAFRDGAVSTLTAGGGPGSFQLWYDTQPRLDTLTVEFSADQVGWRPAALDLRSGHRRATSAGVLSGYGERRWWTATPAVPPGSALRFTYRTDAVSQGRGVLVAGIGPVGTADGWTPQHD
ncbi:serine hydrolase domain-containing protein [Actinoplanes couchii]|uniref:Serine hydrolase n=1 Tax=Actinoplanes couchii TaxID=403638 RepID=A0ABQ3XKH5_9ACTN|nr:serine hydrolase [Actinoplanes couchii]MDR6320606.1 CubicO group peptidase (beta-lactamase class C family) [Actinoplanes couchii]GID59009.1 serine hydrolase [Actinoplanes couchii]